jgi:phospholipid/cholesterol/gamma-HCH transport system substrate-binding protein
MDVMDVLGGRQLGNVFQEMGTLMTSLRTVLTAFSDPRRAETMVKLFDEMLPLVVNANHMSLEMAKLGTAANRKKNINKIIDNLVVMTETLNRAMPQIQEAIENSPHMAKDIGAIVENLSKLTTEMNKVLPALAEVAPELPRASRRAIEAMDEAVIVLKAMQKSFLLKGSANEVREEELAAEKKKQKESEGERAPASER